MSAAIMEPSFCEFKTLRNDRRQKSLLKDSRHYHRLLEKREATRGQAQMSVPASYRRAHPCRAARVVARSWLSKGEVQGETDMPRISSGHFYFNKPSVSRVCVGSMSVDQLYQKFSGPVVDVRALPTIAPKMSFNWDTNIPEVSIAGSVAVETMTPPAANIAATVSESANVCDFKLLRNDRRQKSLVKNNEQYKRRLEKRNATRGLDHKSIPASYSRAHPHRAARAVARSWIASGEVHGASDMPSVSIGHFYFNKPSVSRVLVGAMPISMPTSHNMPSASQMVNATMPIRVSKTVESDVNTDVADPVLSITSPMRSVKASIEENTSPTLSASTAPGSPSLTCLSSPASSANSSPALSSQASPALIFVHNVAEEGESTLDAEIEELPTPALDADAANAKIDDLSPSKSRDTAEVTSEAPCVTRSEMPTCPPPTKRESILKEVVAKVQQQARESERKAEVAQAHVLEVERKLAAQRQNQEANAKKQVLQSEKQRAALCRKQRNQEAHQTAVRAKADCALQEAIAIREKAKLEATALQEQVLVESEIRVQAEIAAAKEESELLKLDTLKEVLEDSQKVKSEAEAEVQVLKARAQEAKLEAEGAQARVEAMQANAESHVAQLRKQALADAAALKSRVEEQLQKKVEAAVKVRRESEKAAEDAKASLRDAELEEKVRQQKEEALAKKCVAQIEKQRAAQIRKERNQAAEQKAMKEKAERALQEASAIRDQAQVEASSLCTQLVAEARRAAKEDSQMKLSAAELEAETLKQEAAKCVETALAQAQTEANALKMQAAEEKAAAETAKARAEALHAEAESSAQSMRQRALGDVTALKTRVLEQLQEKRLAAEKTQHEVEKYREEVKEQLALEAVRQAKSNEKQEKATAVKLAKAMEQQRSQKIRKQSEKERHLEQLRSNELAAIKAQAEEEKRAIRTQALAEAAELRAKAEVEARAMQECIIAEARREAEAQAATLRAEAESFAATIRADAVKSVPDMTQSVEAEQAQTQTVEDEEDGLVQCFDMTSADLAGDWHVVPEVEDDDWDAMWL